MKPRDFWIVFPQDPYQNLKQVCYSESTAKVYGKSEQIIHVREVVTIDWEKVRREYYNRPSELGLKWDLIKGLVEKQLAGDSGLTPVEKDK